MSHWFFCRFYIAMLALISVLGLGAFHLRGDAPDNMKRIRGKYHIIYTDMPREMIYEAIARLNAMAEQYNERTKGFGGQITRRLPFFMFSNYKDYIASVGRWAKGTGGIYNPNTKTLKATVDISKFTEGQIWHTIQHEGWHQFSHMVVCKDKHQLPVWLDESLGEYFGEAIWTGDRLACGVIDVTGEEKKRGDKIYRIPPRLGRVQKYIKNNDFKNFSYMIEMSHTNWNDEMNSKNYDQVWSMAHFFIHAKNGKYRRAFQKYIEDMAGGEKKSLVSFRRRFKTNITTLQKEYNKWWTELKGDPTAELHNQIMLETLMGFLGRADMQNIQKKTFRTADEFFTAARKGKCDLDINNHELRSLWLPPSLLKKALSRVQGHPEWRWELKKGINGRPELKLTTKDGTVYLCRYTPKPDKKGVSATVEITRR